MIAAHRSTPAPHRHPREGEDPRPLRPARHPAWAPACAGMTEGASRSGKSRSLYAIRIRPVVEAEAVGKTSRERSSR